MIDSTPTSPATFGIIDQVRDKSYYMINPSHKSVASYKFFVNPFPPLSDPSMTIAISNP